MLAIQWHNARAEKWPANKQQVIILIIEIILILTLIKLKTSTFRRQLMSFRTVCRLFSVKCHFYENELVHGEGACHMLDGKK